MVQTKIKQKLEKNTESFVKKLMAQGGPPLYDLTPKDARAVLEKLQSSPIDKPAVDIEEKIITGGPRGKISIRTVRPKGNKEKLPVLLFIHGAGWVLGSAATHDLLTRRLSTGSNSAIVFVNYSLSPEAKFPIAIEEQYAVLEYIGKNAKDLNVDLSRLSIVGDSVGGNMAIAITKLALREKVLKSLRKFFSTL